MHTSDWKMQDRQQFKINHTDLLNLFISELLPVLQCRIDRDIQWRPFIARFIIVNILWSSILISLHIMLPFELTKDTPYLALSGELWSVFYEYFNKNWSCYKGFLLYWLGLFFGSGLRGVWSKRAEQLRYCGLLLMKLTRDWPNAHWFSMGV